MRIRRRKNQYIFAPEEPRARRKSIVLWLGIFLLLAVATVCTANFVMDHQVQYLKQSVTVQNLPSDLENWTILHFSDLHGRELGDGQAAIQSAIKGLAYSSVVFTGDMIGVGGDIQPFLDLVALLPASTPKLYIPGDSDPDYLSGVAHGSLSVYTDWAVRLQDAGVTIVDEPICFTRNKSNIYFIPEYLYTLDLDSMEAAYRSQLEQLSMYLDLSPDEAAQRRLCEYHLGRVQRIRDFKSSLTEKDIQIVLTHTPLTREYVSTLLQWSDKNDLFSLRHAALVLSGHYCGGQWRIPGVGALYVPEYGWFPDDSLLQGLDYLAGIPQYISPGLGASDYYRWQPGRLFNSPVVTMIALTARMK
ncbi:MAG: metallophosphoesterase [Aristaeellaceae bacterium]